MEHEHRATWRSYDPDLNRVDIHGNRPLKPHERAARDLGALAFDMVLAGMKAAREASPRAHVIDYYRAQRSPADGRSPITWRGDELERELAPIRAERKAMLRRELAAMRRAA